MIIKNCNYEYTKERYDNKMLKLEGDIKIFNEKIEKIFNF